MTTKPVSHDERDNWKRGGKKHVLDTYIKLHESKLGAHWIWVALERISAGESEQSVMSDYGYQTAQQAEIITNLQKQHESDLQKEFLNHLKLSKQ